MLRKIKGRENIKLITGNDLDSEIKAIEIQPTGFYQRTDSDGLCLIFKIGSENYALPIQKAQEGVDEGELIIKNKDDKATLKLKSDGSAEILGDEKTLVSFSDLKTAFDTWSTAVKTTINTHTHIVNSIGSPTATAVPPLNSDLDISSAELKKIKGGS